MNPTRRLMLKVLPASLVTLLLGKQAQAAPIPQIVEPLPTGPVPMRGLLANSHRRLIEETACKILVWMVPFEYKGRFTASCPDFPGLLRDVLQWDPRQPGRLIEPEARVTTCRDPKHWNAINIDDFLMTWRGLSGVEGGKLMQDLFREMCRGFKFGRSITNAEIDPSKTTVIRYCSRKYTKDVDDLSMTGVGLGGPQLAYTLGCLLLDMIAVPESETADSLELPTLYVRREAFMLELMSYTTHAVPKAIDIIPADDTFNFLFTRQGITTLIHEFESKWKRKPRALFINNVLVKEYYKWAMMPLKYGLIETEFRDRAREAFEQEFGVVLQVFTYSQGGDNDTRLVG